MMRMMLAAAAVAGLAAAAKADFGGGPAMPQGGYPAQPAGYVAPTAGDAGGGCATCDKYGTHPLLRKLCWWKTDGGCGPGGCKHHGGAGAGAGAAQQAPPAVLVFPYHQYNRGPRDFFMWEPGR